jgi:ABC-2 type transport system permease protein
VLPLTYPSSLLKGIWQGAGWIAHPGEVAVLVLMLIVLPAISSRLFRWE